MKRILIAAHIIGTCILAGGQFIILNPGSDRGSTYGYTERDGSFRATTPGEGTVYGQAYNDGTVILRQSEPLRPNSYQVYDAKTGGTKYKEAW